MASFSQDKKSKMWSVRFRVIENNKEVNKRLGGYAQKKEANAAYVDFMSTYVAPPPPNQNYDLNFTQLFSKYQEHIAARLKESSQVDIAGSVQKHILPIFGNKQLNKITKMDILNWQNTLNEQGYSYKYKDKLRSFLSTILKFAVRYYDLPLNVVSQVEPFRNLGEKKEMILWSIDEYKQFMTTIGDDILYKTFFMLLYYSGCRKGEVFALSWEDIDFETSKVYIHKNLTRKCKDGAFKIDDTPKNDSSNRRIGMPTNIMQQLLEYKHTQTHTSPTDLVFGGKIPLAENTVTRTLKMYCKLANVKEITPHTFRHSHASLLISLGQSIVMVSKRLGHSNIEQTLNTYSHLMPNQENELIDLLKNL